MFPFPMLYSYDEEGTQIDHKRCHKYIHLDYPTWTRASLPVKLGGLRIQSAVQLAPSAFCCWLLQSRPSNSPTTSPGHTSSPPGRCHGIVVHRLALLHTARRPRIFLRSLPLLISCLIMPQIPPPGLDWLLLRQKSLVHG